MQEASFPQCERFLITVAKKNSCRAGMYIAYIAVAVLRLNLKPFDFKIMDSKDIKEAAQIKKWAIWYNQITNIFWSILNFTPIGYFWFRANEKAFVN
jgi:hypothetical protein